MQTCVGTALGVCIDMSARVDKSGGRSRRCCLRADEPCGMYVDEKVLVMSVLFTIGRENKFLNAVGWSSLPQVTY